MSTTSLWKDKLFRMITHPTSCQHTFSNRSVKEKGKQTRGLERLGKLLYRQLSGKDGNGSRVWDEVCLFEANSSSFVSCIVSVLIFSGVKW